MSLKAVGRVILYLMAAGATLLTLAMPILNQERTDLRETII